MVQWRKIMQEVFNVSEKMSVVVVDDDEEYAQALGNHIRLYDEFEFSGYALDGEEAMELIRLISADVIILDLLMPKLDGLGFLRRLAGLGLKRKPKIIINSASCLSNMIDIVQKYGVDYISIKPQSFADLCSVIKELMGASRTKEADIVQRERENEEKRVADFLHHLGVPSHLSGYKYMRFGIILAIHDMSILESVTGRLYPAIAKQYNTKNCCVERAIRHAISVSWTRGNKKLINDVFGYTSDDNAHRPTNAEYMAMAADDFRLRFKYGAPV